MARRSPPDFSRAVANPELRARVPCVVDLTPQMLADLWMRMPRGPLPKEFIFAAGVALAIEALMAAKDSA